MTVGVQATNQQIDTRLTSLALNLRAACQAIINLQQEFPNALALEAVGYASADAATAETLLNYMSTVAGCYKGTVQQGGAGGTGAVLFDFDNALSVLWAGQ